MNKVNKMEESKIIDIVEQSFNSSHMYEEDDVIEIKYIEINRINYAIYIRYNGSNWPLVFLVNLSNKKVVEIDHGLKGGPLEIKSDNEYILMRGRLLGQGDGSTWYKYNIETSHLIGPA
jgi:hypothetical protein